MSLASFHAGHQLRLEVGHTDQEFIMHSCTGMCTVHTRISHKSLQKSSLVGLNGIDSILTGCHHTNTQEL